MSPIQPAQCRAARGLLDWTQSDLAEAAQLAFQTIRNFERSRHQTSRSTLAAIRRAFEDAGVKFIEAGKSGGQGVRLRE
jgi:transcriptional regulator with XRE-family HTH domain